MRATLRLRVRMQRKVIPFSRDGAEIFGVSDLFRELAEQSGDVLMLIADNGCIRYVSPAVASVMGWPPTVLTGRHVLRFVAPSDAARLRGAWERAREDASRQTSLEVRAGNRAGDWQWLEANIRWLPADAGRGARWVVSLRDVTARRELEHRLVAQRVRAHATLRAVHDGVVGADADGRVDFINPAAERILGWQLDQAIGRPIHELIVAFGDKRRVPDEHSIAALAAWFHALGETPVRLRRQDGDEALVQLAVTSVADSDGRPQGLVLTFRDAAQANGLMRELNHRALHDALTGLLNRDEFERRLYHAMALDAPANPILAVVNLDQFRVINEGAGHAAGDALLRDVAAMLGSSCGPGDLLARLGADEYGWLLAAPDPSAAVSACQRVLGEFACFEFTWGGRRYPVSASIGLATSAAGENNVDAVMRAAEAACRTAKSQGGNRVHAYSASDGELAERQSALAWLPRLHTALQVGDLQLLAYDVVPTAVGKPTGRHVEVLVVLPGADGRSIPAREFLPVARRFGLMARIDAWVLGQVSDWLQWRDGSRRAQPEMVAVNVSGSSLGDPEFRALAELLVLRLPEPSVLCMEITDGEAIADVDAVADFMHRLRRVGCRFGLDDFGAGLSSFAWLRNLPVDFVKIDGQFVRGAAGNGVDAAMVEAIHSVAKTMHLQTIAERVESEAVWRRIREIGVDYCQGYLFGLPRPLLGLD